MFHDYRNDPPGNLSLPPALTALLQIFSMFLGISPGYCAFKILAVPQPSDAISELLQVVPPPARTPHAARAAAAVALWLWAGQAVPWWEEGCTWPTVLCAVKKRARLAFMSGSLVLLPTDAAAGQPPQEGEPFWCGDVGAAVLRCLCGRGGARAAVRPFLMASPLLRPAHTAGCWSGCSAVLLPAAPWGRSEAVKETRLEDPPDVASSSSSSLSWVWIRSSPAATLVTGEACQRPFSSGSLCASRRRSERGSWRRPEFGEGLWGRRALAGGRCPRAGRGHRPAGGLAGTVTVTKQARTAGAELR